LATPYAVSPGRYPQLPDPLSGHSEFLSNFFESFRFTAAQPYRSKIISRSRSFNTSKPSAVGTQLAALSRIKAFYGLDQTDISFRNQIEER